jgi:hypothetical protein
MWVISTPLKGAALRDGKFLERERFPERAKRNAKALRSLTLI